MAILIGILLVVFALHDAFEVMVLPRRITRRVRLARFYYRFSWLTWRRFSKLLPEGRNRQNTLSVFGPMSLFGLFFNWLVLLITGFALVQWGLGSLPGDAGGDFRQCLYQSGETFFTLGYGDVTPVTYPGKMFAVIEAGTGFGFMAIVIGYLPVLYQAFSKREQSIALLDARAGSPPTAGELLRRASNPADCPEIERFLAEWEVWAAELLESHLSFPVLSFYRSQHDNQSWLAALATVLDASSVLLVTGDPSARRRAQLTFAMARHTCVDLCLVFWMPPTQPNPIRLTDEEAAQLFGIVSSTEAIGGNTAERLSELRALYEPFLQALSDYFLVKLPRFFPDRSMPDNWQTSAWTKRAPGITELPAAQIRGGEHFGSQ